MTKLAYRLVAIALSATLSLVAAEAVLRIMNMGFGNSPMEPDPYLHHVHPKNYSFVQQHPSGELGGFRIDYNADGRVHRGAGFTPPSQPACRIALMGDSFTEGGQVPFAESFAGLLEAASPRCEVRNYGVRSYSPAIYLVQWTRDIAPWQPTHVFVLLFGNDVREDVTYLSDAALDSAGFPTAIHGPAGGQIMSMLRQSYVARFGRMVSQRAAWAWEHSGEEQWTVGGVVEEHPEWAGPTPPLVAELHRRISAAGSAMTLMAVPSRYRLMGDGRITPPGSDFHDTVGAWAQGQGITFLPLNAPFEKASRAGVPLYFLQDIHFTSEGHALLAATVGRAHPEWFDPLTTPSRAITAAYAPQ
jgi:hypothetical protein